MVEHKLNGQANDWMQCTCGKIFKDSRKKKRTALQKMEEHLLEKMSEV